VAVFAVGVLYVIAERFEVVRLTADIETPAIYLDSEGHVRDYNDPARELFPALASHQGRPSPRQCPQWTASSRPRTRSSGSRTTVAPTD
jgi:hypothetical protein